MWLKPNRKRTAQPTWRTDTLKKTQKSKVKTKSDLVKLKMRNSKLTWQEAKDIKKDIKDIALRLKMLNIDISRIFCFRTQGSKSRSYARIWSMPKIFQRALKIEPAYVIEVLAKHYDKLNDSEKKKVLIHELLHIPQNFSGALLPHRSRGRHLGKMVNKLFELYKNT